MAIIACPECKKHISDAAPACVGCGYPINAVHGVGPNIQTIEQTGKQWKLGQLVGVLMVVFGLFSSMANAGASEPSSTGPLLLFFGVVLWIGSKIGAWWHHH
jgi:hypothetical protein